MTVISICVISRQKCSFLALGLWPKTYGVGQHLGHSTVPGSCQVRNNDLIVNSTSQHNRNITSGWGPQQDYQSISPRAAASSTVLSGIGTTIWLIFYQSDNFKSCVFRQLQANICHVLPALVSKQLLEDLNQMIIQSFMAIVWFWAFGKSGGFLPCELPPSYWRHLLCCSAPMQ